MPPDSGPEDEQAGVSRGASSPTPDRGERRPAQDEMQALVESLRDENLEPITPEAAVQQHLALSTDKADSTLQSHEYRLSTFIDWCATKEINNLNPLNGRDLASYRSWRDNQLPSPRSLEANMYTLRVFLRTCVKIDAVPADLPEKVIVKSIPAEESARDVTVPPDDTNRVLRHLSKFHYADQEHLVWLLAAAAGLRLSAQRAPDTDDYVRLDTGAMLLLRHRPDTGTRLKNEQASERAVYLREEVAQVIDDYLDSVRPDVRDEHGRSPLLASRYGRLHESTMRKYVYRWTRPCVTTGDCPHGRDLEDCDARQEADQASKCPSSKSPHPIRRGHITAELDAGVPRTVIADRCDVSPEVIETSYDTRNSQEKMELRKQIREERYSGENPGYWHGITDE